MEALASKKSPPQTIERRRLRCRGRVQGVGFRPFVFRLANRFQLSGWVKNTAQGVTLEIQGPAEQLDDFVRSLRAEKPAPARLESLQWQAVPLQDGDSFHILTSQKGKKTAPLLPDLATCSPCLAETLDPRDRRYRYPFTNCTECGPRFSIITDLPYDRPNTTMAGFSMCAACQAEYADPRSRRFHAQPNACPTCGPQLEFCDSAGMVLAKQDTALLKAADWLRSGKIVAIKGLGGFHLMVDATNPSAVQKLRTRKHRPEKPFALMMADLQEIKKVAQPSELETSLLSSPRAPIILLQKGKSQNKLSIAENVAPNNPRWGIMLPNTPLHHLLLRECGIPLVATSGNLSEEPICTDNREALDRLGKIADAFLLHNRPIARPLDDSILQEVAGRSMALRSGRGDAPLSVPLPQHSSPLLALGAQQKNTVALALGRQCFLSQHLGDLHSAASQQAFEEIATSLSRFYEVPPSMLACDLHPDYHSTQHAMQSGKKVFKVQHHVAHVHAAMLEHGLRPPLLAFAWDGNGMGNDGTLWGGECFLLRGKKIERIAHLRPFPLPGGEAAIREPRRTALSLIYQVFGNTLAGLEDLPTLEAFSLEERKTLQQMLKRNLNCPRTSAMGRLFDGVASLTGIRHLSSFEAQAAMEVEFAASGSTSSASYELPLTHEGNRWILEWEELVQKILQDLKASVDPKTMARKFHRALVKNMVQLGQRIGEERVLLTGGCFQNRLLSEWSLRDLQAAGFKPYAHERIPPNDGGIALGQIGFVLARSHQEEPCV